MGLYVRKPIYQKLHKRIIFIILVVSIIPMVFLGGTIYHRCARVYKAKIEDQYPDLKAISTSADSPAALRPESKTYGILVRGFNLTAANKIYKFDERLVDGALPQKKDEVLMGVDLMEELEVELDDTIEVIDSVGKQFVIRFKQHIKNKSERIDG